VDSHPDESISLKGPAWFFKNTRALYKSQISDARSAVPASEKRNQAVAHYTTMLLDTNHRDLCAFNTAFHLLDGYGRSTAQLDYTLRMMRWFDTYLNGDSRAPLPEGAVSVEDAE